MQGCPIGRRISLLIGLPTLSNAYEKSYR